MFKKILFFSFCVFLTSCGSPPQNSLSKVRLTNQKGFTETITNKERLKNFEVDQALKSQPYKKIIRVYKNGPDTHSVITTYHPNGHLHQSLDCKNGQAHGAYQEWHSNGLLKVSAFVLKGIADIDLSGQNSWFFEGDSQAFDEKGQLAAIFRYQNGRLEGESVQYYSNGQVKQTTPYLANLIHGSILVYDENGSILEKTLFINGLKEGVSCSYWKKNRLRSEETFQKGRLIDGTYFNSIGNLIGQVSRGAGQCVIFNEDHSFDINEYQNGVPQGEVKVFDAQHRLINCYFQNEGIKHGKETLFNPLTQKPSLSIDWVNGKIHGVIRTWYENGRLESQREMSLNRKQGISTAWYQDGNLMLVEKYDSNHLIKGKYYEKANSIPISTLSQGQGVATLFDENGIFTKKVEYFGGKPVE